MTISLKEAKTVCTAAEYQLVQSSTKKPAKNMTADRAKKDIAAARRLRDKYRSLAQRQRREARGKQAPRGKRPAAGNDRTVLKAKLFDETRLRFEAMLQQLRSDKPATKSPAKAGKKSSKSAPAKTAKTSKASAKAPAKGKPAAAPRSTSTAKSASLFAPTEAILSRRSSRSAKSDDAKLGRKKSHFAATPLKRIRGHVSAAGRRKQGRRDSR